MLTASRYDADIGVLMDTKTGGTYFIKKNIFSAQVKKYLLTWKCFKGTIASQSVQTLDRALKWCPSLR